MVLDWGLLYSGPAEYKDKYSIRLDASSGEPLVPLTVGYRIKNLISGIKVVLGIEEGPEGPLFTISCCKDNKDQTFVSDSPDNVNRIFSYFLFKARPKKSGVQLFGFDIAEI